MAKTPVYMPKFGMTMTEADITEWYVEPGAEVAKGDPLLAIETEKTNVDIEAPESGYLGAHLFEAGDVAEVGAVLAYVADTPEEAAEEAAEEAEGACETKAEVPKAPEAPEPAPGGRTLSKMRRIIAENMRGSLQNSAQLTHFRDVRVDALSAYKETLEGVSYNDLFLKAYAIAARQCEKARLQLVGDRLVEKDEINIGLAVALEDGLIVPVVRNVDQLSLHEIAGERKRLVGAARSGGLSPEDTGNAIATVTNLGAQNIDCFTPILNAPEPVILGVGRIMKRPWVEGDSIVAALVTTLSITFDHQVLDGKDAADFLESFVRILEDPAQLG